MFTKMGKFYTKTRRKFQKTCLVEFSFRNDFRSGRRNFQLREHFLLVDDAISLLYHQFHVLIQINVIKPNLVFLHILECTIRNTFLTNINLGRLSDIASHCKKYIYILQKSRFYHSFVYLILYFTFILQPLCTIEYGNGCLVSLPVSQEGRQDMRGGHIF